jgi:endonuclease/exonuclease/phosphatase (EEP) superfamily protein YafD
MFKRLLIVTCIGGLLPLGAELWWGLDLLTHFRVQYLAVALVLLVPAIALRHRLLSLALVTALAINAWPLVPYLPTGARPAIDDELVLLSINVNGGNPDYDGILTQLLTSGADLVALLELTPALDARLPELGEAYPYRYTVPDTNNFGIAVLSRRPLVGTQGFDLTIAHAIEAGFELPSGPVTFMAVHLPPPLGARLSALRNQAFRDLAMRVRGSSGPLIVCGDFNSSPYSPWFTRFERESGLRDARRGQGVSFSWPSSMPLLGVPIDHCLYRGPLGVASVERMEPGGSDHYPVRVTLGWQRLR